MLLPLYGELARNAGQLLCVYYFDWLPMEAAGIAETIPIALTGGQAMLTMTAYSYVGDATSVSAAAPCRTGNVIIRALVAGSSKIKKNGCRKRDNTL